MNFLVSERTAGGVCAYLDYRDLACALGVSKNSSLTKTYRTLWVDDPLQNIQCFSSQLDGNIGQLILVQLRQAKYKIVIASDKCTNEEFLRSLLDNVGNEVEIEIITGADKATDSLFRANCWPRLKHITVSLPGNAKMHNKFMIIDNCSVITGSPNLSYAAYNYNIESFVRVDHKFIAYAYANYYLYMKSVAQAKNILVTSSRSYVQKLLDVVNIQSNRVHAYLAPIVNIKNEIQNALNQPLKVVDINMFLVSHSGDQKSDIISSLVGAVKQGAKLTMKVDAGQYKRLPYVRLAVESVVKVGGEVFTIEKSSEVVNTQTKTIESRPQFHDKLILIKYANNQKRVIIGSAGFSTNVQLNLNLENMVSVSSDAIYDRLLLHFLAIRHDAGNVIEKRIVAIST